MTRKVFLTILAFLFYFELQAQERFAGKFATEGASRNLWFKVADFRLTGSSNATSSADVKVNYADTRNKFQAHAFVWLRKSDTSDDRADWQYESTWPGDIIKIVKVPDTFAHWEMYVKNIDNWGHIMTEVVLNKSGGNVHVTVNSENLISYPSLADREEVPLKGDWYWNNGKVLIGTKHAPLGEHLLYVNGSVLATEVNVKLKNQWPDYVFEEGYMPMPLEELESYIKENKHLPDIPKEKEVMENGVNLLEMNQKLLQKIEELTLYIIQQEKEIKKYEKFDDKLKALEHSLNLVKQEQDGLRK